MNVKKIFSVFLIAVLGAVIGVYTFVLVVKPGSKVVVQQPVQQAARYASLGSSAPPEVPDFTSAAEKSVEAVVHVMTKSKAKSRGVDMSNPFYQFFYGPDARSQQQQPVLGSGSGVIISEDGYIVTNNHVIDGADEIQVILNDKRSYNAKLVGTDPTTDIALLKIEEDGLHYLTYGDSENLKVGEWVLAVGNPFNLTSTVTAGIVSAKSRSINIIANRNQPMGIESFIQTDAAVNPGNSGGALVNTYGQLVGINAAIASQTGSYTGYSFAVPVSIVKKVVSDIKEFGVVQRALIGIQIQNIDAEFAKNKGLDKVEGVYVGGVTLNGGAAEAGVKEGDVVMSIEGVDVNTTSELQEQVSKHRPGDKVNLIVKRGGKTKQFTVTLRNSYGSTDIVKEQDGVAGLLGAQLQELTNEEKQDLGVDFGLKITELSNGKLRDSGVREGFIILKANRVPIKTISDLKNIISATNEGLFLTGVYPNGQVAYYGINLDN